MVWNCGAGADSWESLGLQEDKPVNHKENQPWIFIGKTGAEAEAPILWPPDSMVGFHQQLNRHAFEQTLGDIDGQESLVCCRIRGWRIRDNLATEQQ